MTKEIIAVDMDNTINKFSQFFFSYIQKENIEHSWTSYEQHYDIADYMIYTSEEEKRELIEVVLHSYNFWINIPPIEGAIEYLKKYWRDDWYIVTHPWRMNNNSIRGKRDWIKKYMPFVKDNIIFQLDKWNNDNIFLIFDDNPEILKKCYDRGKTTIKFNKGYNEHIECDLSFSSWYELENIIQEKYNKIKNYWELLKEV